MSIRLRLALFSGPIALWVSFWGLRPYLPEVVSGVLIILSILAAIPFLCSWPEPVWDSLGELASGIGTAITGCFVLMIGFIILVIFIALVKHIWYAV